MISSSERRSSCIFVNRFGPTPLHVVHCLHHWWLNGYKNRGVSEKSENCLKLVYYDVLNEKIRKRKVWKSYSRWLIEGDSDTFELRLNNSECLIKSQESKVDSNVMFLNFCDQRKFANGNQSYIWFVYTRFFQHLILWVGYFDPCVGRIAIKCKGFYPWRDGIEGDDSTCAGRSGADDGDSNRKTMRIAKNEWRQPKPLPIKRAGGTSFRPSGKEFETAVVFEKASLTLEQRGKQNCMEWLWQPKAMEVTCLQSETSLYESWLWILAKNDFVQKCSKVTASRHQPQKGLLCRTAIAGSIASHDERNGRRPWKWPPWKQQPPWVRPS